AVITPQLAKNCLNLKLGRLTEKLYLDGESIRDIKPYKPGAYCTKAATSSTKMGQAKAWYNS
ncbi:MAG TPA: hypothetical protein DD416_09805, partial [Rhodobacteraceae bacterium]|nr:hypothetical protein [Paracoccaceae bacterium]